MNIYLNQYSGNSVVLTLQENSLLYNYSGINPFYLFEFTSLTTKESIFFIADNISPLSAQNSYDKFIIYSTGSTSTNYSAGTIHLNPGVQWHYKVYEQNQQFNFNVNNTVSKVEQGKVQFITQTTGFNYIMATGNTSYIAFNDYN